MLESDGVQAALWALGRRGPFLGIRGSSAWGWQLGLGRGLELGGATPPRAALCLPLSL